MSAPVGPGTRRTARLVALAAFLVFALTGGGRIAGSDEVTMFELSRAMLHGRIDVPEGATLRGPDGRFYSKNTAGQAVLAMPLVGAAEFAARAARFRDEKAVLAARFGASFLNAAITALLLAAFYAFARRLGVKPRSALAATALLGFTTPVWVYAKSFMADPLQALGLLLALGNAALASAGGARALPDERRRLLFCAFGAFLAVSVKLPMLPIVLLALTALGFRRLSRWIIPLAGVALAGLGHLAYNLARFGNLLETGYGAQASAGGFSTPLPVGLYGLLLSPGKGIVWFAPAIVLALSGVAGMLRPRAQSREPRHGEAAHNAGVAIVLASIAGLVEYGTFEQWAADGSWGPRYLLPLLAPAFLGVAFALDHATRARKRLAWALGIAGLVVTLGGVGVYFGAEMRATGDYPYTMAMNDPRFMERSHFNPRYTPIVVHWRMLAADLAAHARGEMPRIGAAGAADARLGISATDQQALVNAIDVWWLYARYAGLPGAPLTAAALALLASAIAAAVATRRAAAAEEAARA